MYFLLFFKGQSHKIKECFFGLIGHVDYAGTTGHTTRQRLQQLFLTQNPGFLLSTEKPPFCSFHSKVKEYYLDDASLATVISIPVDCEPLKKKKELNQPEGWYKGIV